MNRTVGSTAELGTRPQQPLHGTEEGGFLPARLVTWELEHIVPTYEDAGAVEAASLRLL